MQVVWDVPKPAWAIFRRRRNRHGDPVAGSHGRHPAHDPGKQGLPDADGCHGRYLYVPTCTREQATKNLLPAPLDRVGPGRLAELPDWPAAGKRS